MRRFGAPDTGGQSQLDLDVLHISELPAQAVSHDLLELLGGVPLAGGEQLVGVLGRVSKVDLGL